MALISLDDGACRVVVEYHEAATIEQALTMELDRSGITAKLVLDRAKPEGDGQATQRVYVAALGLRHWQLSVTIHPHDDAPGTPPEVILIATASRG